jgi:hypothetical protein
LLLATSWATATAAEPRLTIAAPEARFEPLSKEVLGITIGPDEWLWCWVSALSPPEGLSAIKTEFEREYDEESPQIQGAELALLEPDGRAWFYANNRMKLIGYDGSNIRPSHPCNSAGCVRRSGDRGGNFENMMVAAEHSFSTARACTRSMESHGSTYNSPLKRHHHAATCSQPVLRESG